MAADDLYKINAYWRAANYLAVGQIYLYDNPLLREPLTMTHIKSLAHQLAEQSIGSIAAPLVLLRRHIRHVAEPATTMRVLRGDDGRRAGNHRGLGLLARRSLRPVPKAAGKYKGRPVSIDAAQVMQLSTEMGPAAIARCLGIARSSVYRLLG